MAVVVVHQDREYLCRFGEELQTDLGVLQIPDSVEPGAVIETHLGTEFQVRYPRGPDFFRHFERTGAPMLPRDIGLMLGECGLEAGDRILDSGTGTGVLSTYLGRIGASVVTFEQNPDFADVARRNLELAGVDETVEVRNGDVTESINELDEFSAITLDMGDAPTVIEHASDILLPGGTIAVYSPFIEDARASELAAEASGLRDIKTRETIQRNMDFNDRGSRPTTTGVGHTGYLTFGRAH